MIKREKEIIVNDFVFYDEELAEKAKKEYEGIRFIKTKIDMGRPKTVEEVYNKLIDQELFETPVGINYLRELQDYLNTNPAITNPVKPIPVEQIIRQEFISIKEAEKKAQTNNKFRMSLVANIVLVIIVIAMFAITLTSKHPNIFNYEQELLDKYAGWETELSERELQLREKERELGIQP